MWAGGGERLAGGYVSDVWRVGDTVRRTWPARAKYIHSLLGVLVDGGFEAAPKFLGRDDEGREMLGYIAGVALIGAEPLPAWEADAVAEVAAMTRRFHDVTAGTGFARGGEVVCHNDLSPKNTIYTAAGWPIAFIDWDLAAPGRRIEDVAHVAWQWGARTTSAVEAAARNVRAVADGYGLSGDERASLVDEILSWQRRCWTGMQGRIDAGSPRMTRLRDGGAVTFVQADEAWTLAHRDALDDALA